MTFNFPRATFGIIVLNGEPFVRHNLRALYPFAHQIIVVEGAAPAASVVATADGHSVDGTLDTLRHFKANEDPENKLLMVTAEDEGHPDGFWPGEKDEQSQAYARRVTTQIALEFLVAYPTAQEARELRREAFETFCHQHGYLRRDWIAVRYAQLQEPVSLAAPGMVQAYRGTVCILAQVLLTQVWCRNHAMAQLHAWFDQHPDAFIFKSLPGTGDFLAPGLLVKFGDHRDRFLTAGEVQALAGTCPVTKCSDKRKLVKFRHACDHEFRHFAVQFARTSKLQSGWAAAYWQEIRPRCDSDAHADRILANRWLAILWRM